MKILVTGARGFIGKNLIVELKNKKDSEIFECDKGTSIAELNEYCETSDFVFHLAGVNRPQKTEEYMEGNFGFTSILLETLKKYNNKCPIMMASSTQALLENPYGISKKAGEKLITNYGKTNGIKTYIYRLPNVFGKFCKPNYNSVIATFCHNITRQLPIVVNDPKVKMNLVYIDDVVEELMNVLNGKGNCDGDLYKVPIEYSVTLGEIVDLLYSFKECRDTLHIPCQENMLIKKLYSTYLSYLPSDQFRYPLKMNCDDRGSFTEFIKTPDRGQVSVNISKPGITKGNHWHHTKNEKFLVVSGRGVIRFRKIDSENIFEYYVNGNKLEVIDIPVGYTHNIQNLGDADMVTIMWCNEIFNSDKPDTHSLEV